MSKDVSEQAVTMTLQAEVDGQTLKPNTVKFKQTDALVKAGIAVLDYGALLIPKSATATAITLEAEIHGVPYKASATITSAKNVGDTVTLAKQG